MDDQADPIDVFGVGPAAFFLDPALVERIALPDMSAEVFATVGEVAETSSGNLVVMIEHSGGEPESRYAAAVDVFEEVPGGWTIRASARDLGESGPNHLVVNGDAIGAELNVSGETQLVGSAASAPTAAMKALSPDILTKRSARLVEEVANVV